MAYIHPLAVEHHRKRWTRPDASRFAAPGTPEAKMPGYLHLWAEVARQEQAVADEAKARALAEQDEIEREVLALRAANACVRIMLADLKFELALRALGRKYSPDQPRVRAGNPDGGQWTDGGGQGGERDDPIVLSDAVADSVFDSGTRLAASDGTSGYPINLQEEEARGGHTISAHVNRSPEALIAQAQENFDRNPNARDSRSGSFPSLESATKLVNSTLAQNRDILDRVAAGELPRTIVFAQFNSVTGVEAVIPRIHSQPYFRETYGVGVMVVHDPFSSLGYRVLSAFPSNR